MHGRGLHVRTQGGHMASTLYDINTSSLHYTVPILHALHWRHNERDGISNHQPHDCLLNHLFRRKSKKKSKLTSLAFVRGIHWWVMNSPQKGPVTRKMFPFDDIIMVKCVLIQSSNHNQQCITNQSSVCILNFICYFMTLRPFEILSQHMVQIHRHTFI